MLMASYYRRYLYIYVKKWIQHSNTFSIEASKHQYVMLSKILMESSLNGCCVLFNKCIKYIRRPTNGQILTLSIAFFQIHLYIFYFLFMRFRIFRFIFCQFIFMWNKNENMNIEQPTQTCNFRYIDVFDRIFSNY